jgi:peptidoglycan/LPS O-acetylase OafA/YrhL
MAREVVASRRRKNWIEFVGVAACLLAISLVAGLPAVTRAVPPGVLIAAVLAAAGSLIAVFGGMLRDLDELERRIAAEALALSFVVTIAAMSAYPFLEGVGLPPLRPQTVAFVLVSSFAVGIERFSRRYQ